MSVDVLLGLQWGDEGKGKIVDFLAPNYDFIARFQAFIMEKIPGPTLLSRDNLNSASIPNISQNSENIFPLKNPTDIKSIAASYLNT